MSLISWRMAEAFTSYASGLIDGTPPLQELIATGCGAILVITVDRVTVIYAITLGLNWFFHKDRQPSTTLRENRDQQIILQHQGLTLDVR